MTHADPASVQAATLAFLEAELARVDGAAPVSSVTTHISIILLSATLAWKVKRAVQLPYLDFRSADHRLALCKRELALNRRTAPGLYRRVRRVMRQADGRLCLEDAASDDATLVDAVLEMRRFDEDLVLDRMAVGGRLDAPLVTRLASVIAEFHERAAIAGGLARSGSQRIGDILAVNEEGLAMGRDLLDDASVQRVAAAARVLWQRHAPLLDERQRGGHVRLCHGDLHLRNIVAIDGVPTLFDCLEFDAGMATIDVLYDLAFALMDLWHRDLQGLANLLLNRYLDAIDESGGLPLLGLFMAMRATVRAHVTATQALDPGEKNDGGGAARREAAVAEARAYLALADRLLQPRAVRLVAIGGLSGSGKSTAAAAIAASVGGPPGARILSSDRLRKRLHGVAPETRLPETAYQPEVSAQVYARLCRLASETLGYGHSVIVDAVFDRRADRDAIEAVAVAAGVAFRGIWLEAPAPVLFDRVVARRGDPSDAGREVVRRQLQQDIGQLDWQRVDAGGGHVPQRLRDLLE